MSRLRYGVHPVLEAEADRLIRESLRGVTSHTEKGDVLTDFKRKKVRSREVYVSDGVPERATRQGMFHRVANPVQTHLNSRDGLASAAERVRGGGSLDSLADFVESHSNKRRSS